MRSHLFKKSHTKNTMADPSIEEEKNLVNEEDSTTTQTLSYEKNCGDLKVDDIIWYVRSYLTDHDLIHYNQLSRAFSGKYNLKGEYIWHQIEAADLSFYRQQRLFYHFRERYQNNPVFPVSPKNTWQKLFYYQYKAENPYHNIDNSFYCESSINPVWNRYNSTSDIIPNGVISILYNHKQASTPRTRNYLSSIPLDLLNIIAKHSNPKKNQPLIKLMKCYARFQILLEVPEKLSRLILMPIMWIVWIKSTIMLYELFFNASIPGIANIHATQINTWTEKPELHIVSCEQALNPSNINSFGNFSTLMTFANFTENLTSAALLACTTWLGNCRPSASFDSEHTNVGKFLEVGCDYSRQPPSSGEQVILMISMGLLLVLPMYLIFVTLAFAIDPFLQRLKDEPTLAISKALENTFSKRFVKEKEADKIIRFQSHFFKNVHSMLTEEMRKEKALNERERLAL